MPSTFANAFGGPEGLLVAAALIVFFIVRQFSARRVLSVGNVIAPAALLYFAVQSVGGMDSTGWVLLGISLSFAIALGVARGLSFRVWTDANGYAMMQSTPGPSHSGSRRSPSKSRSPLSKSYLA